MSPGGSIHDLRRDFLLTNEILVDVLIRVQHAVDDVSPYMWLLDTFGGRDEDRILNFSIRSAREEAWQNAVLLAHRTGSEREQTIARLDVHTTVLARLVRRPGGPIRPVIELIRSGENTPIPDVIARLDPATQTQQPE